MTLNFLGLFSKCSGCRNPHPGHTIERPPGQEGTVVLAVETPAPIVVEEVNTENEAEAENEAEVAPIIEALEIAKCFPEQMVHSIQERSEKQAYLQSLNRTGKRQKMWAGMTKYGTFFSFFLHSFFLLVLD